MYLSREKFCKMNFVEPNLGNILPYLEKLNADSKPLWGIMSAQRMIEHLTDTMLIATGDRVFPLEVAEEKLPRMLAFLESDKPMAQNIEVSFAPKNVPLRNEEIELAIDEFVDAWLKFEEFYERNPNLTNLHAYYGPLNYQQWLRLHSKHLTHHLAQFGLI